MLILYQCDCILFLFFSRQRHSRLLVNTTAANRMKNTRYYCGGSGIGGSLLFSITQAYFNFANNSNQSAVWCSRTRWNSRTKDHIQTPPVVCRKVPLWHKMTEWNNKQNRGIFQRHSDEIATEESPWLPTFPLWLPASNTGGWEKVKAAAP